MRVKILITLLLFLPSYAQAGPHPVSWVKHHRRFTAAAATLAATSTFYWKGTGYCQRGDVEHCIEGYGSRRVINGVSIGLGVVMLGAAEGCWKDQPGWKFCYALAYGTPAIQAASGAHDFLSYAPEHREFVKSKL